jgi:hypothetical protein
MILLLGFVIRYSMYALGFVGDWTAYMLHIYSNVFGVIDYFLFGIFLSFLVRERGTAVIAVTKKIPRFIYIVCVGGWFLWVNYESYLTPPWQTFVFDHLFLIPLTTCLLIGWYILSSGVGHRYRKHVTTPRGIFQLLIHPRTFLYGIGFISYGIYLYHYIFFNLYYLIPNVVVYTVPAFLTRFFELLFVTCVIAFFSYTVIEFPLLRLKSKLTK